MNNRVEWIDSYKGILILLVLILHVCYYSDYKGLGYDQFLARPFNDMRMPAFFFISGFLLSKKQTDFQGFFAHRFRQIVVPYFIFFLVNYSFWIFFARDADQSSLSLIEPFIGMIKGKLEEMTPGGSVTLLTAFPLWFVTTLFITEMYFFAVKKISKNNTQMLLILAILAPVGFILSFLLNRYDIRPWWNLDIAITATVFYGFGYFVKTNNLISKIDISNNSLKVLIIILLFTISISASFYSGSAIWAGKFGNPASYYIGAFSGILALIFFVQFTLIGKNNFLEYFGRNAYYVLALQMIAIYFTDYLLSGVIKIPSESYTHSLPGSLFYFVLLLLILAIIIKIFDTFMPFILGRKIRRHCN